MHTRRSPLALAVLVPMVTVLIAGCSSDTKAPAAASQATSAATVAAATTPEPTVPATAEQTVPATAEAPTSVAAAPETAPAADGSVTIDVTVGTDPAKTVEVKQGATVTIKITDPAIDQEYHLHGVDLEQAAKKGETAQIVFTAADVGEYELESHITEQTLLVIVVS